MPKNKNYRAKDTGIKKRPKKKRKLDKQPEPESIIEEEEQEIPYLECCICMRSDLDDLAVLVNNEAPLLQNGFHPIATLSDCDEGIPLCNTIFYAPCGKHAVCYDCLKRIALNFNSHPIGHEDSLIPCPYPFDNTCENDIGMKNYFSHSDIKKILSSDEYDMYMRHAERFQFPGYEIVKCPRPIIINDRGDIGLCDACILVPIKAIQNTSEGHLIMECDQNSKCYRRSCYHCHTLVRRRGLRRDEDILGNNDVNTNIGSICNDENIYCERCVTSTENTNPKCRNRYFYKPDKRRNDGQNMLYRNEEIPDDVIIDQLLEIVESENLFTRCMECLTTIYKTEQCNTITHCGVERCYACGRTGTHEQDLGDHWDVSGVKGCPRFDHSSFWNEWGHCGFKCREGYCYSDTIGPCTLEEHQGGIQNMIDIRKRAHIYHAIKSLLPEQREYILKVASQNSKIEPYLPRYMCNEYRTYLSDIVYEQVLAAQAGLLQLQSSISSIEQEILKLQEYTSNDFATTDSNESSEISFELSDISSDEEYTPSDEMFENQYHRNTKISQYESIIERLSFLEFKKVF